MQGSISKQFHRVRFYQLAAVVMTFLLLIGVAGAGHAASESSGKSIYAPALKRTLQQGSTGSEVRIMQSALKRLGYYTGAIDGIFGKGTKAAVEAFQRRNLMTVNGVVKNAVYQWMLSPNAIGAAGGSNINNRPLQYGDKGSAVLDLQRALTNLGYYYGPLSGNYLSQTKAAVILFQQRNGLMANGIAGQPTLNLLYSGRAIPNYPAPVATPKPTQQPSYYQRTLRYGMYGEDVASVQSRLYQLGYYAGDINGRFDAGTRNAVLAFQTINYLTADGVVGPYTWNRLFSTAAIRNPGRNPVYPPVTAAPTQPPTWQPPAPNQLGTPNVGIGTTGTSLTLSWDAIFGASGYTVNVTAGGLSASYTLTPGSSTSYTLPSDLFIPGATLNYRVQAFAMYGVTSNTAIGSFKIPNYVAPPVVVRVQPPDRIFVTGSMLSWDYVSGAKSFYIEYRVSDGFRRNQEVGGDVGSIQIPQEVLDHFTYNTTLTVTIRSSGADGTSSDPKSISVDY